MAHCIKNILLRPLYSFSLSNWFLFSLFLGMDNGAHFSFVSNVHPRQHTSTMGNKQQKKEGGAKPYTARKFFLLLIILAVPCTDSRSTQTQSPCRLLYTMCWLVTFSTVAHLCAPYAIYGLGLFVSLIDGLTLIPVNFSYE